MQEFHFLRPNWLLALLPLCGLLVWLYLQRLSQGNWAKYIDPKLQAYVLIGNNRLQRRWPLILFAIAGLLTIIALAGPSWERLPQPVFKDQSALVIVLDLSQSMNSQDVQPSRLQRAKHKITDILHQRDIGETALIVYAATAFVVTPLTDDYATIAAHIASLNTDLMPAQGSRPDIALAAAQQLLQQAQNYNGDILLITDGFAPKILAAAAEKLRNNGHRLLVLGVGTPGGAPIPLPDGGFVEDSNGAIVIPKLNAAQLGQLTHWDRYHRITLNDQDIQYLLDTEMIDALDVQTEATELQTDTWRDVGPWLLLPVLALAVLAFRRGILVLAFITLLPWPYPAHAFDWDRLWLNNNQRGAKQLDAGQAEQAAQLFTDPDWQAAALYRAGDYQAALEILENTQSADGYYNKGNTLAKLGDIPAAIEAYQQALDKNPNHEDAKYNLELLQQNQPTDSSQQQNSSASEQQQPNSSPGEASNHNPPPKTSSAQNDATPPQPNSSGSQNAEPQHAASASTEAQNTRQEKPMENQQNPFDTRAGEAESEPAPTVSSEQQQRAQAMEQWLRRIPDDPGGLLKRKFYYQYQQQAHEQEQQPW